MSLRFAKWVVCTIITNAAPHDVSCFGIICRHRYLPSLRHRREGVPTGHSRLPDRAQPDPQQSIRWGQLRVLHGAVKDSDLVAQGENLHLKRRPVTERITK